MSEMKELKKPMVSRYFTATHFEALPDGRMRLQALCPNGHESIVTLDDVFWGERCTKCEPFLPPVRPHIGSTIGRRYHNSNYNVRSRRKKIPKTWSKAGACTHCTSKPWAVKPYTDWHGNDVNGYEWDHSEQPKLQLCETCFNELENVLGATTEVTK
jgi:hypothetical protein